MSACIAATPTATLTAALADLHGAEIECKDPLPRTLRTSSHAYRITQLLTRTAHATLYLGYNLASPTITVVLKRLPRTLLARREASLHHRLVSSPFCVPLLDHVTTHHHIYLVLPYYPHGDLFDLILAVHAERDLEGAVKEQWAVDVFGQLVQAVHGMHQRRVYHRDLKPENVFVTVEGEVRVGDFGLATEDPDDTALGFGSEFYMPPESFAERAASEEEDDQVPCPQKSDVWSLGVLLLNLLCGRNPWSRAEPTTDPAFADYLQCPFALREAFGLTEAGFYVVARMLCPNVEFRATMEEVMQLMKCVPAWLATTEDKEEEVWEEAAAMAHAVAIAEEEQDDEEEKKEEENAFDDVDQALTMDPTPLRDAVPLSAFVEDDASNEWMKEMQGLRLAMHARDGASLGPSAHEPDELDEDTMTLATWTDATTHVDEEDALLTDRDEDMDMLATPTSATFQFLDHVTASKPSLLAARRPRPAWHEGEEEEEAAVMMMLEYGGSGAQHAASSQARPGRGGARRGRRGSLADCYFDPGLVKSRIPGQDRPATALAFSKDRDPCDSLIDVLPWHHALMGNEARDVDGHFAMALAF